MKKIILLGLAILLFTACQKQEQRYFTDSAEIDVLKAGIAAYEKGDWDTWKSHFADTAKVFANSKEGITVDARLNDLKQAVAAFSSYGFDKENEYIEMVIDDDKETWVNYWAQWEGEIATNQKKISVPVHLTVRFVDGKIVKEEVYFDGTEMNKELAALANMSDLEKTISNNISSAAKAWNTNDGALWATISAPEQTRYDNGIKSINNQAEYIALINSNHTVYPDLNIAIDDYSVKGNKATIYWTVTGTNTGEFNGNPPTGKKVKFSGIALWEFNNDGMGVREDVYSDPNSAAMQLGYSLTAPK